MYGVQLQLVQVADVVHDMTNRLSGLFGLSTKYMVSPALHQACCNAAMVAPVSLQSVGMRDQKFGFVGEFG